MSDLSLAVIYKNQNRVKQLLTQELDINERDDFGYTPLINAAINADFDISRLLMAHQPDINKEDIQGGTPLYWAIENNDVDLARLYLEAGANVDHYTGAGQPVGAYAIMKENEAMQALLSSYHINWVFCEDYLTLKLLGHRFELSDRGHIYTPDDAFMDVSYEGFDLEYTLKTIHQSLTEYINTEAPQHMGDTFTEHMQLIAEALAMAAALRVFKHRNLDASDAMPLINALQDAPLWILPVSFAGHAITFVKFKHFLARCDRGLQSGVEETVTIYKITKPQVLQSDFLFYLLYENLSEAFIKVEMPQALGLKSVGSIPTRSQVAGNCSWANVEAAIPTSLFMKLVDETGTEKAAPNMEKAALKYFHDWREWDRDTALEALIKSYKSASQPRRAAMTEWMGEIFGQSLDPHDPIHIKRLKKMLPYLTHPLYGFVLKSFYPNYLRDANTERGLKLRELLLNAGLDFEFFG